MRAERSYGFGLAPRLSAAAFLAVLAFFAAPTAPGLFGLAEEKEKKGDKDKTAATLKMTCSVHGVTNMTLEFSREAGAARKVEIIGTNSGARWTVKVDSVDMTPGTQSSASPGQVKLHEGDTISWTVTGSTHGIVFPTQAAAEAMFKFDTTQGKPLGASTAKPGFTWGTGNFGGPNTTLAVATVKAVK